MQEMTKEQRQQNFNQLNVNWRAREESRGLTL